MIEYKILSEWSAYRVGSDGSIWSRWKIGARRNAGYGEWRVLRTPIGNHGYRHVHLHDGSGRSQTLTVPPLVCEAFHGLSLKDMEVRHLNGNQIDDRADNLQWGTHAENVADQERHGTRANGERNGNAKLSDADIAEIRSLKGTMIHRLIAERFGVNRRYIGAILSGDWRKETTHEKA